MYHEVALVLQVVVCHGSKQSQVTSAIPELQECDQLPRTQSTSNQLRGLETIGITETWFERIL